MKKNVHTAGKSRKQKKIMLLLLELLIILLLAIALFITTKLSKIEKNKLDMNDVSINDDLSDETKEAMAHYNDRTLRTRQPFQRQPLQRKQRRYHVGKHRYETAYHQSGICLP